MAAASSSDCLSPDNLYPLKTFRRVAGVSATTQWRVETAEGLKLPKVRSGGKVFIKGSDAIWWLEERARRQAELGAK